MAGQLGPNYAQGDTAILTVLKGEARKRGVYIVYTYMLYIHHTADTGMHATYIHTNIQT